MSDLEGSLYSLVFPKIVNEIDNISLSRQYDFINAEINETIINQNQIDIDFTIKESETFYVERINIYGNNITHENVIRDRLEIDEGDPFNELLNAKSINTLKASGLFKKVKAKVTDGSELSTKIIDIELEEKPTGEISLGAGAGSEGGTLGFSVNENNFLGKGIKLGTSLRLTEDTVTGSFSVKSKFQLFKQINFNQR